jgi:hypothetical protein
VSLSSIKSGGTRRSGQGIRSKVKKEPVLSYNELFKIGFERKLTYRMLPTKELTYVLIRNRLKDIASSGSMALSIPH